MKWAKMFSAYNRRKTMNILFINGSPNQNGNTAALASELLKGKEYETLNLTDYKIGSYRQNFEGDELGQVITKMEQAEVIVIGSPLYWHNICGSVRNVLDRFYGLVENGSLSGRTLYFLFQGASPEKWMLEAGEYTMKRFTALYGMKYAGMATNRSEAAKLAKNI
jgi:multimeric flavodoxin WrbA